jgi:hypothetical protein
MEVQEGKRHWPRYDYLFDDALLIFTTTWAREIPTGQCIHQQLSPATRNRGIWKKKIEPICLWSAKVVTTMLTIVTEKRSFQSKNK